MAGGRREHLPLTFCMCGGSNEKNGSQYLPILCRQGIKSEKLQQRIGTKGKNGKDKRRSRVRGGRAIEVLQLKEF